MTAIARSSMQQVPLLEVPRIVRKMRLTVQSLTLLRDLVHPTDFRAIDIQHLEIFAFLPQLLCHSFNIHAQIVPEELANFGVLMVTH